MSKPPDRTERTRLNLVGRVPHGDSLPRRLLHTVRRGAGSSGANRDLVDLAADLQVPLSTGRRVVVTSERGGAGKTTVAALLATTYATRRSDPVLAATSEIGGGSLGWRLGATSDHDLAQLRVQLLRAASLDLRGVTELLPRTAAGLWTLPPTDGPHPTLVRDVTRALSRLFTLCVTDAGGLETASTDAVLGEAHAVVVVVPATPDGVRSALDRLKALTASDPKALTRAVVALNHLSPGGSRALRVSDAVADLEALGVPVARLPFDRHLAAGAPVTPPRLRESSVLAMTGLAGAVLRRAHPL